MGLFSKFFGPPDKNKFAGLLLDAIKKAGETAAIRYDAEEFRLVAQGQAKQSVNLANLYQEYCAADSAKREQALRRCVRSWFASGKPIPASFADAVSDLLPAVRTRCQYEFTRLSVQLQGMPVLEPAQRVIADHLMVGLV